uniref:Uncharacterized protein n=1 Tax=Loxodonta africana TaxID=9785 RepID=G3UDD4_LOXAF
RSCDRGMVMSSPSSTNSKSKRRVEPTYTLDRCIMPSLCSKDPKIQLLAHCHPGSAPPPPAGSCC